MKQTINQILDYQRRAQLKLPSDVYGYYISGSDDEITLRNNIQAYQNIYLAPRVLVDMSSISMKTKILGQQVSIPFGIAPFAMQRMLHPDGQMLTAAEALRQKTAYCLSMLTSTTVSDVVRVNPTGFRILQLYFLKNADYTLQVIRMAEKQGFKAFAITVDTQMFGKRRRDERAQFSGPVELQLFRQLGYNFKLRNYKDKNLSFVDQLRNDLSWDDIVWIKKNTHLKIILKGVMSHEDIPMAQKCGVDAIWISNHGGRQLDTSPATILVLPSIRKKITEIGSKMELYIDGGVKKGSDIFKCLALGADFVFLGRGFLFSVSEGEEGVKNAFEILKSQLKTTMMLCGTNSVQKITGDFIWKYPKAKL